MQAPKFYEGIREMTRSWFMHVRNARSVFRRAGVRVSSSPNPGSPVLSLPGTRRVCLDPVDVFVGENATFAILPDGSVWAWGGNEFGRTMGRLYASEDYKPWFLSPQVLTDPGMQNAGITNVTQISSTEEGGTLFQRDGATTLRLPTTGTGAGWLALDLSPPASFTDVIKVATFSFTGRIGQFLLRSNGEVWRRGQTLPGANQTTTFPWAAYTSLQMGGSVVDIEARDGGITWLLDDGTVRTWGNSATGGNPTPITIADAPSGIVKMAQGGSHVAVLTDDGEIWTAGSDQYGQAGIGTASLPTLLTSNNYASFRKALGDGYTDVAAAPFQTFAVKDGSFYSCGRGGGDFLGALGGRGPSSAHEGTLTEVTDPDPGDVESVYGNHGCLAPCYKTASGCLYTWGQTLFGSTAQGVVNSPDLYTPTSIKVSEAYPAWQTGP